MPKLNLKDDAYENEEGSQEGGESQEGLPSLRDANGNGGKISPIILILVALIVLAAGIFALNYFKVIDLWGKRTTRVTETVPMVEETPSLPPPDTGVAPVEPPKQEPLPVPGSGEAAQPSKAAATPAPKASPAPVAQPQGILTPGKGGVRIVPSGDGGWTVQFAAWHSSGTAELQVRLLSEAGYDAYIDEARHHGGHWFRVRVGRFATRAEAQPTADRLQNMTEDTVWITRIRSL
jgi:cell division protein FtsN